MDNVFINLSDMVAIGQDSVSVFDTDSVVSTSDALVGPAGPPGPQGPKGDPGRDGQDGRSATIEIGTTTTGQPGTDASVVNSGTETQAVLNFTIPRGEQGIQGIQGEPGEDGEDGEDGAAATISVGSVQTVAPEYPATVTNSGTTSAAVLDFQIPQGIQGEQGVPGQDGQDGQDGAPGQAATIAVGTTTTGNPGTNASVTNSGSSSAAVFNFTIPRGADGTAGVTPVITATASVDSSTGTPSVTVYKTGTDEYPQFDFAFEHLKGATGSTGPAGADAVVNSVSDLSGARSAVYFNDGTLIGYRTVTGVTAISTAVGSLYYADIPVNDYWAFIPVSADDFISAPTVSVSVLGNGSQYMWAGTGATSPVKNTSTNNRWALSANAVRLFRATSHASANYSINIIAIGKWK